MNTIEAEISSWLNSRPAWLKILAERILSGETLDEVAMESIAADLIADEPSPISPTFTIEDLPTSVSTGSKVELVSIGEVNNINALNDGSTLDFNTDGLTIIYGDNGCGKSGFARLAKDVVEARHHQQILPNAFQQDASTEQSAAIRYRINDKCHTLTWPQESGSELRQIHFYDEACGDHYLVNETEVSYRPPALKLLDELIFATDKLRKSVDVELGKIDNSPYQVPEASTNSPSGIFVSHLSTETTDEQIEAAATLPDDAEEVIARLTQEENRLQATNPAAEKARLTKVATNIRRVSEHISTLYKNVGADAIATVQSKQSKATSLRAAADISSKNNFTEEPLEGVGSSTWRALWEAAEAYLKEGACLEHDFSTTDQNSRCPLCQQIIGTEASERLGRFHTFVHDETAQKAEAAENIVNQSRRQLENLDVAPLGISEKISSIELEDPKLAESIRSALRAGNVTKKQLLDRLNDDTDSEVAAMPNIDLTALDQLSKSLHERAEKTNSDDFSENLRIVSQAKQNLKSKIALSFHKEGLKKRAAQYRQHAKISEIRSLISTQAITRQATTLTRTYVGDRLTERFLQETQHLGLSHVTLDDKGGGKGKVRHRPSLSGATQNLKTVRDVLSEGEQTALSLAGLLTEIAFDESRSAVVFDDPVTSLDHGRRERVSKSIARLAKDRQVIVFTHDLTFLGDLIRAANSEKVNLVERSIVKTRSGIPGVVLNDHPWKAKDAKARIGNLREELATLKREETALSQEEYDFRAQHWAGKVSETWERLVRNDIVGKVVERGTTEVRPKMIRLLAQITDEDNVDFQEGYGQISKWAPRHDKSEEVNFVTPSVDEMEVELDRIDTWRKRIVKYSN